MKESILKYKYSIIFFLLVFIYILGLTSLFPMHWTHEMFYAKSGNPFILQWEEVFQFHGRLLTHIPARFAFQSGYPYFYIIKAFLIFSVFYTSLRIIYGKQWENKNYHSLFLLLSIFLFINAIFPVTTFMMYYATDTIFLFSYYFPGILILIFLQYYINILINNDSEINIPIFCMISFLTGSSFEMSIACIPFIITIYILLKIKQIKIPYWYWYSLPFFFLGFSILLLAPGSNNRLTNYVNITEWSFFGQTLNWLDLGWKKYFYSLARHLFDSSQWFNIPGFIPNTFLLQIIIFCFTYLNWKKYFNIWHKTILFPILYWLFSWYTCIVMSASPEYHLFAVEFSKFFMYISLTASIYYYLQNKSEKTQTILISLFLFVVFVGQGIQIPAIYKAKQEYLTLVEQIENGEITKLSYDQLPKAKLGNITIITFGNGLSIKYPTLFQ